MALKHKIYCMLKTCIIAGYALSAMLKFIHLSSFSSSSSLK